MYEGMTTSHAHTGSYADPRLKGTHRTDVANNQIITVSSLQRRELRLRTTRPFPQVRQLSALLSLQLPYPE